MAKDMKKLQNFDAVNGAVPWHTAHGTEGSMLNIIQYERRGCQPHGTGLTRQPA